MIGYKYEDKTILIFLSRVVHQVQVYMVKNSMHVVPHVFLGRLWCMFHERNAEGMHFLEAFAEAAVPFETGSATR